jgi:hypothetical protein
VLGALGEVENRREAGGQIEAAAARGVGHEGS